MELLRDFMKKAWTTGMRVQAVEKGDPPKDVEWVRDVRINARTKRLLMQGFWKQKRDITGKVAYVASESVRSKLRKEKKLMIKLINPCAQRISIIVAERHIKPLGARI